MSLRRKGLLEFAALVMACGLLFRQTASSVVFARGGGGGGGRVEAAASGAAEDFVLARRFVAALAEALTAGPDSAGGLMAEADLTVDLALALALDTAALAIRISAMATLAPTAIRTSATTTRFTPLTAALEWVGPSTAERITDRRRSVANLEWAESDGLFGCALIAARRDKV
jgi:hypothetical protein